MKQYYYSVYDSMAKEFGPLFPAKNDDVAKRHFKHLTKGVEDPENYTLWCFCELDQDSGQFGLPFERREVVIDNSEGPIQGFDNK